MCLVRVGGAQKMNKIIFIKHKYFYINFFVNKKFFLTINNFIHNKYILKTLNIFTQLIFYIYLTAKET